MVDLIATAWTLILPLLVMANEDELTQFFNRAENAECDILVLNPKSLLLSDENAIYAHDTKRATVRADVIGFNKLSMVNTY